MAFNKIFSTPEEILQEFQRQSLEEDDLEGNYLTTDNEVASESDDEILPDLRVQDEFDVVEDENERSSEDDLGNPDERQFELGKDGGSIWTNMPIRSKFARVPPTNVIKGNPGPRGEAVGKTNILELFSLFITDEVIQKIVTHTNEEIDRVQRTVEFQADDKAIFDRFKWKLTKNLMAAIARKETGRLDKNSHQRTVSHRMCPSVCQCWSESLIWDSHLHILIVLFWHDDSFVSIRTVTSTSPDAALYAKVPWTRIFRFLSDMVVHRRLLLTSTNTSRRDPAEADNRREVARYIIYPTKCNTLGQRCRISLHEFCVYQNEQNPLRIVTRRHGWLYTNDTNRLIVFILAVHVKQARYKSIEIPRQDYVVLSLE
ncbi:unnamed protein product [Nesidiocoris tenuis]|uniref:PiggyBac transposable element-derived protein domain-containing protein n=1 Tax=Nesidiocoris tenuis TaxID=355587 RepID=A0A6H5HBF2_9HEMI|nr:unnamed protein product [Nesidiocoris tenuis]